MRILMDTTGNDEGPIVLFDCLKGLYNPLQATSATLADLKILSVFLSTVRGGLHFPF